MWLSFLIMIFYIFNDLTLADIIECFPAPQYNHINLNFLASHFDQVIRLTEYHKMVLS